MPFPGEGLTGDPFSAQQATNAALLAESGHGDPIAAQMAAASSGPSWPTGMGGESTSAVSAEGMPSYLANAGAFVPSPEERDPNVVGGGISLADPRTAETKLDLSAVAVPPAPVQPPSVEELRARLEERNLAVPAFLKDKGDKKTGKTDSDGDGLKKKCPSCGTLNAANAFKCSKDGTVLIGVKAKAYTTTKGDDPKKGDAKSGGKADKRPASLKAGQERSAVLHQSLDLGQVDSNGLVWKVACKTGTLALSPGLGQVDLDVPLQLTREMFDDMVLSAAEKAFPYITVPETHANGSLENTGYVRQVEVLGRDALLADSRLPTKYRSAVQSDPASTDYLLCGIDFTEPDVKAKALRGTIPDTSIGVKFNYRNKRTGKMFKAAFEHLALTPVPWVDGLVPFGLSQDVFDQAEQSLEGTDIYVDAPVAAAPTPVVDRDYASMDMEAEDALATLPEDDLTGELPSAGHTDPTVQEDTKIMTVEEMLAQQQAEHETREAALRAELESVKQSMGLSQATIGQQGDYIHLSQVNDKLRGYQEKGVAPFLLLAARQVYEGDAPSKRPADASNGLSLSVQVAKADGQGNEEKKLQTPSEITDFLLSAVAANPAVPSTLAHLQQNLDELNASAAQAKDGDASKRAQVEAWERETYPDRFADDGKGKRL